MKDEANDEVDPNVIRGIRSEQFLQDMQTCANQIDGHEEYVVRGLMKGDQMKRWCLQSYVLAAGLGFGPVASPRR
jgi:hypothetical protein